MASIGLGLGGNSGYVWRFFRSGGLDQVRLETSADLKSLDRLDQKLWAALSCPTRGLEFDERTLDLIDTDKDGRIRVPEILAAVRWACAMLKDADVLAKGASSLPIAQINDATAEGKQLAASARQILKNLGKPDALEIGPADTADQAKIFAKTRFNGDGIVQAEASDDAEVGVVIKEVIDCFGAETDRSGLPGIGLAKLEHFWNEAQAYDAWWKKAEGDAALVLPLGDKTESAAKAFEAVKAKIDDYFSRCRLAAFDSRAAGPLNRAEKEYEVLAPGLFSADAAEVAGFPLAKVESGRALPLTDGLNPAWAAPVQAFVVQVVAPIVGVKTHLKAEEWGQLVARFAAFEAWKASKAGAGVEKLGLARVRAILASRADVRIKALIEQDKALEPESTGIAAVDKLVLLNRDLFTLLNNFVAFRDFYSGKTKGIFQAGTLYIDGRSCELCVRVDDMAKHGALASLSRTYLVYCDCTRPGSTHKITIAAGITAGDADNLLVGRNGIFYDRKGQDWDATISKIVEHPISIRQAFWSPYKRIGRMIGEQVEKMAASRDKAAQDKAAAGIADSGQKLEAGKTVGQQAFDVGKFAGIFAAIGLALGALGTALAAVLTGLLGLAFWQIPLVIAGVMLLISGPSMVIAWLKLRQRNLGPILDANGWAVNTRAKINIVFGGALTGVAELPPGAQCSVDDPFAEKKKPWRFYTFLAVMLVVGAVLWQKGYIEKWLGGGSSAPVTQSTPPQ